MLNQLKHLSEALKGARLTSELSEDDFLRFNMEVSVSDIVVQYDEHDIATFTLNSTEFTIKKK